MPPVTLATLRTRIAAGTTSPLCVLVGDDDAEKAHVADEVLAMVDEGLRAFNVDRLHGGETRVDVLVDAANLLPMMVPRRVVVVLDAERLLVPKRPVRQSEAAEKRMDAEQARLEAFIDDPPAQTTVVFVCGPLDERRRVVKRLRERADVVDCGSIVDAADAELWVKARAAKLGGTLEPAAVRALVERVGIDIGRLRAGLERVLLYALGQPTVTVEDVRVSVPAGPDAQEDFGIAKAIWRGDAKAALRELGFALDAGAFPVVLLGQLRAAAESLPAGRVASAIDALLRTDLALKSSGGDPRMLLERLTLELCGTGAAGAASGRRGGGGGWAGGPSRPGPGRR